MDGMGAGLLYGVAGLGWIPRPCSLVSWILQLPLLVLLTLGAWPIHAFGLPWLRVVCRLLCRVQLYSAPSLALEFSSSPMESQLTFTALRLCWSLGLRARKSLEPGHRTGHNPPTVSRTGSRGALPTSLAYDGAHGMRWASPDSHGLCFVVGLASSVCSWASPSGVWRQFGAMGFLRGCIQGYRQKHLGDSTTL